MSQWSRYDVSLSPDEIFHYDSSGLFHYYMSGILKMVKIVIRARNCQTIVYEQSHAHCLFLYNLWAKSVFYILIVEKY